MSDTAPNAPEPERMWRWNYDGDEWTMQDYTLAETEELENLLGLSSWCDIRPMGNAKHAMTCIAMRLRRTRDPAEVEKIVAGMTLGELDKALSLSAEPLTPTEWDGVVPLAGPGSEATTS